MGARDEKAPAQRGNAGGGTESHVGAGLVASLTPAADHHHDTIRRLVDSAPIFTAAQKSRLALLMRPGIPTRSAA